MIKSTGWGLAVLSAALLGAAVPATAADKALSRESFTFGTLTPPSEAKVRLEAANWLKGQGTFDRAAFDALWSNKDKTILDRLSATFEQGNKDAAKALKEARSALSSAPTALPEVLSDSKRPLFFRANLALAYARALTNRKVYEEALETLKLFKAEQTVDPASFLFHKAVAEHGLMLKKDANDSIVRLLDDVPSAPERYKVVAALMHFDMVSWQEKDLNAIARKMDNIQRRLDLARGGKKTQKLQKDVVARLDEIIKELENQNDSDCDGSGNCPGGKCNKQGNKPGNTNKPSSPMKDSNIATNSGPGQIDAKKIKDLAEQWGKLPPKDREASMRELTQGMPERYREVIKEYFRRLSQQEAGAGSQ
jgi:tetratricopeptide (TPR) repeat protein